MVTDKQSALVILEMILKIDLKEQPNNIKCKYIVGDINRIINRINTNKEETFVYNNNGPYFSAIDMICNNDPANVIYYNNVTTTTINTVPVTLNTEINNYATTDNTYALID